MGTVSFSFDGPEPHVLPVLQSSRTEAVGTTVEVTIRLLATPARLENMILPMSTDKAVELMGQLQVAVTAALAAKR